MPPKTIRRAGYPSAKLYEASKGTKAKNHLLWGDWLKVTGPAKDGRLPVRARGDDGWMCEGDIQDEALLELVFVDVGQGDGCLIVTPDDRKLVIDAGQGEHMARFLEWRFGQFRPELKFKFDAFVASHSDIDHCGGFSALFGNSNVEVENVFHNGLVERSDDNLGKRKTQEGTSYVTEVVVDHAQMKALVGTPTASLKKKAYARMLHEAINSGRVGKMLGLGVPSGDKCAWLPGFPDGSDLSIQVLGPAREAVDGVPALRWFGDAGKTKNGHSVLLKLRYRKVSILLGGDLNIPAEHWLLRHHTGLEVPPHSLSSEDEVVSTARSVFAADFVKSCHHGSADFTHLFLRAMDPIATVVSSGDDEPYAHPRSDTLGTIGRFSRGSRPLIFSTELARSAPERIKSPSGVQDEFQEVRAALEAAAAAGNAAKLKKANDDFSKLLAKYLQRSVAVYGAINLRTDGDRAVMAYRIERPRKPDEKWDIYKFERDGGGQLRFVSKHE